MKRQPAIGEKIYCVSLPQDNTGKPHASGARPLKIGETYRVNEICSYIVRDDERELPKRLGIGTDWWTRPEHFISWPDLIEESGK